MTLFCVDLDNTLIYSYKHDIGAEKRCAEIYQGREISFLTEKTHALLHQLKQRVSIIPVTTRSVEQYARVDLGIGALEYALACNGGVLLVNGREDASWHARSLALAADAKEELSKGTKLLLQDKYRCFEIRNIQGLFTFTKSEKPLLSLERLKQSLDPGKVDVRSNGMKIYIVPKALNKGTALLRLKERLCADAVIAAGDSEFDAAMLNRADIAIAPKELQGMEGLLEHTAFMPGERVFSEEMLLYVQAAVGMRG